jgi:antitoxin ParD1/3/4
MPNVSLTAEQQRFIEEHVASGRFASASEVMRHALRLMQEAEERRERFVAMLCDVSARADREGTLSADEVDAELRDVISTAKRRA